MNGELLSGGFCSGLLSTNSLMHPWERQDLTETTYDYLFPPLKANKVSLRHGTVIGLPESGKTEMINDIAYRTRAHYGPGAVNIVFCDWLQDALDNLDDSPVQLLMVDDSIKNANSRKSGGNADDAADYFQIRHEFEDVARTRTGAIILVYVTQRFKSLDIVFRNAMYLWFRTSTIDPDDRDIIVKYIGQQAYADLEQISARIYYHHDDSAKGRCLIHLPLEHRTGYFTSTMRERIISMIGRQDVRSPQTFILDRDAIVSAMLSEDRWRKAAKAYRLHQDGRTYDQIGDDQDIQVNRSRVSQLIAQVRGELSLRSGSTYERWVAEQLKGRGMDVKHDGARGRPDIIAKNVEDGKVSVYSCKCLDFVRPVRLPRKELQPEIIAAHKLNGKVVLSVWNLHDMREQRFTYEPANVPETIVIEPAKN